MKRMLSLLVLGLLCSAMSRSQQSTQDEMFKYVTGIEGKTRTERGDFIKKQLSGLGIGYFTIPFDFSETRGKDTLDLGGEDIVVRMGGGKKRVVVGAHFDAAEGSPGANDNGGGVAVLLELIKTTAKDPWNCTVDFVFFDQEENGLLGSQFYIQRAVNRASHYGMINLDIEGMGDVVCVGPVGGGDDNFLMPILRKAAKQTKFDYKEEDAYPGSDYAAFANAGLENISISVVPKGDPELLARMMKSGGRIDPKYTPRVMTVIHTPNDRSTKMSPRSLGISYDFTLAALRLLNSTIH